jgi:hypothetical protein
MFAAVTTMRFLFTCMCLFAFGACGQQQGVSSAGCARSATHEVTWSNALAPDTITARAEGPTCAQAVITLTIRNARGDALWAFAATHFAMTTGDGATPEDTPAVSEMEVDEFLTAWADVTQRRTGELPQWSAGASSLTESAETFSYDTPFERDVYEMLRARDLPALCFAAGAESSQCLIIDPASNAPTRIVTYGP